MIKSFYDRDGDKMERVLNKFYQFVDKIGKQNFILLVFILFVFLVTGIYQTFSLFTSSDGTSVVDGILTYKFILNQAGENAITIAAGSSKNVMVTVSNPDNILLKYGIYYSSSSDLSNVSLGYLKSSAHKGTDVIPAGKDYIVTMKVDNQSSSDVTINLGVSYGLENGGDLLLDTGNHWLDEYAVYKSVLTYLETDGTQYVDTGIYPDQNTKVEFVATPTEANLTAAWFGGRSSYGSNSFIFWQLSNNQMRSDYDTGLDFLSGLTLSSGTQYTVVMDKGSVKVNNTQYLSRSTGNFKSPTSMVFFATKSQSDSSMDASTGLDNRKAKLKFYSAKIYDNGTLVRDFIPVKENHDVECLFDRVSYDLFYLQKVPEPYSEKIEYLESDGTQYIDTGISPANDSVMVELSYQYVSTNLTSNDSVMGARSDGNETRFYPASLASTKDRHVFGHPEIMSTDVLNKHTVIFNDSAHDVYVDGTKIGNLGSSFVPHNLTMYLFALNFKGTAQYQSASKVYYCKIWSDSFLVRDFIPVKDKQGVSCMYDKISRNLFYFQ